MRHLEADEWRVVGWIGCLDGSGVVATEWWQRQQGVVCCPKQAEPGQLAEVGTPAWVGRCIALVLLLASSCLVGSGVVGGSDGGGIMIGGGGGRGGGARA